MQKDTEKETTTKRFTKQRQAILETLKETCIHPDANWVYSKVSKKIPNISLGTVYRNLNILTSENLVRELTFQSGLSRYDATIEPHHHIMCTICSKIEDIDMQTNCDIKAKLQEKMLGNLNYSDITCEILFKGICSECQKKSSKN